MKLSDFLFNIGRPVAFYPGLVKALGSMKQAVFICQMAYWKDKGSDPDGWIYKTAEEIETETSLTYKEQITVRAALVEKKALQERYARTEHQMYFRVDWDIVNTIWDEHLTNGHMPNGQMAPDQRSDGILPTVISLNSNTETTQENTHKAVGLTEKELEQANAKVDAMIANSKKARYENRDKIPEQYLSLCDTYVELTGQKPTKRVLMDWFATFSDWISEGLQPKDIQNAHTYATRKDGGFLVGRPGSLTNTAVALKTKPRKTDEERPEYRRVTAESDEGKKYVPNPFKNRLPKPTANSGE